MSLKWNDLSSLSTDELIAKHDRATEHVKVGVDYYLQELRHRELMKALKDLSEQLSKINRKDG